MPSFSGINFVLISMQKKPRNQNFRDDFWRSVLSTTWIFCKNNRFLLMFCNFKESNAVSSSHNFNSSCIVHISLWSGEIVKYTCYYLSVSRAKPNQEIWFSIPFEAQLTGTFIVMIDLRDRATAGKQKLFKNQESESGSVVEIFRLTWQSKLFEY